MQKKKVYIRIVSANEGVMGGMDMFDRVCMGEEEDEISDEEFFESMMQRKKLPDMPTVFETEGTLCEEDGRITLSYVSLVTGIKGAVTEYVFDKNKRDILSVVRDNPYYRDVRFYSNNPRRQTAYYGEAPLQMELSVYTKQLVNKLTYARGGEITLEYYAEHRAGLLEHVKEYVFVSPIPSKAKREETENG